MRDIGAPPAHSLRAAVLTGFAVDVGARTLSVVAARIAFATLPIHPDATRLSVVVVAVVILGWVSSIVGGYVCARIARRHELRVTAALAVASTAVQALEFVMMADAILQLYLYLLALPVTAVTLGGMLGSRRNAVDARKVSTATAG